MWLAGGSSVSVGGAKPSVEATTAAILNDPAGERLSPSGELPLGSDVVAMVDLASGSRSGPVSI